MLLSRLSYYASSIPTIMGGFHNWIGISRCLLPARGKKPFIVRLRESNLQFKVRSAMDVWVLKEACLDDDYRLKALQGFSTSVIIDIGAGLGDFSIIAAKMYPQANVYAFEPIPDSFSLLSENIASNNLHNIKHFQHAIFSKTEQRILRAPGTEAVQYGSFGSQPEEAGGVRVEGKTLRQVLEEFQIEQCDLLKMDCEGGEYEILFSAHDDDLAKIRRISMEYHEDLTQYTSQDLANHLRKKGFQVELRKNRAHSNIGFLFAQREP